MAIKILIKAVSHHCGNTTLAMNLCHIFSQKAKKVLLVSSDLNLVNLKLTKQWTTVRSKSIPKKMYLYKRHRFLDVLVAPTNKTSDLLSFFESIEKQYWLVLFDQDIYDQTLPLTWNGIIYNFDLNKIASIDLAKIIKELKTNKQTKLLALVANFYDLKLAASIKNQMMLKQTFGNDAIIALLPRQEEINYENYWQFCLIQPWSQYAIKLVELAKKVKID